ncbi:alpha/beta hydrolase [Sphingomonas sp. AP4-R1]|uniref:alpha/beta hydrolase n=1 Tax=Sphingomonas sp. AP4-R1 TaxID=2735134 RepID=UPI0020A43751|nr:alpha/beta hydrolase [Sphingomonas sp. AP4-R1]
MHEWHLDGQKVITLTPHRDGSGWHVIYLHGGAYIHPLARPHWGIIGAIIAATGASVTVPLYALAPENDYRRATALMHSVYDTVQKQAPGASIALAGDSAGGNLALNFTLRRRDMGQSLPQRLLLFSPWLDLELRDPRIRALEARDVILAVDGLRQAGAWWAGDANPACAQLSPLYAELTGLPPIAIFQGDADIFVIDARTFAARCVTARVECDYREYPGAFHVFVGATFTPEARDVFDRLSLTMPPSG